MPFTFAHPAIILPLTKVNSKYISTTALIIGSIIPDFEYFLRLRVQSIYSHTLPGIFYFDLPLALILCFVFHLFVRDKFIANLPSVLGEKLNSLGNTNWLSRFQSDWVIIVLCALIGIGSHLLWDSFTHQHGYFVNRLPELQTKLPINEFQVPLYKILQHSSTIIGLAVISYVVYRLPRRKILIPHNRWYWVTIILVLAILTCFRILFSGAIDLGTLLVTIIAGLLLGIIIASSKTITK